MNLLALVTPIVAMGALLVLMQRVESRLEKVRVVTPSPRSGTRAHVVRARGLAKSPALAAAPMAGLLAVAIVVAGAVIRMAA